MNDQIQIVLIAANCTSAVGLAGMGIIRMRHRASWLLGRQVESSSTALRRPRRRSAMRRASSGPRSCRWRRSSRPCTGS